MTIGEILRQLREKKGMTLQEAAEALDVDWSTLARREKGQTRVKAAEFPAFAKLYGVPVSELEQAATGRRRPPRGIPVINRAPAGYVVDYNHDHYAEGEQHAAFEYLERDATTREDGLFAVVVVGDSMEPTLFEGDYLVLSPILEGEEFRLRDGVVVFVRFSQASPQAGGCCLARAAWDSGGRVLTLSKDNRKYKSATVPFDSETVERIAIAVQRRTGRL